jgi:hypothetical protein
VLFIDDKGANLELKQHLINVFLQGIDGYLMDKTVLFISIIDVIYMLKQYYLLLQLVSFTCQNNPNYGYIIILINVFLLHN